MGKSAVWLATEEHLKNLGLVETGHIICLKGFCMNQESGEKKELAMSLIRNSGIERTKSGEKKRSRKTKVILLGWMHFNKKKNKFTHVRQQNGGGTRSISFANDDTLAAVLKEGKRLFFKDGKSKYGLASMMNFFLANYKCEIITGVNSPNDTSADDTMIKNS